jgi:hypothetical protein
MKLKPTRFLIPAPLFILLVPSVALAYVGPGAGLTAIGAMLSFVGAVLLAILGFIWYPLRRLWRAVKQRAKPGSAAGIETSGATKSGS